MKQQQQQQQQQQRMGKYLHTPLRMPLWGIPRMYLISLPVLLGNLFASMPFNVIWPVRLKKDKNMGLELS